MIDGVFPPWAVLLLAAALLPVTRGVLRFLVLLVLPLFAIGLVWDVPDGDVLSFGWLGYEIVPLAGDRLSRLFATVFTLMGFAGGLYALNQKRGVELSAAMAYAGGAVGVVFAGDLVSLFLFWEIMAIASAVIVFSGGEHAYRPGMRYAIIHFFGGVLLMGGIAGEIAATGSAAFTSMTPDTLPRALILLGFLVNVAAPPLSAWVADAYPNASWSGTVFLSAFTTKVAVYALMQGFPGTGILVPAGLCMIVYGLVYALLENDYRRLLAYAIVTQMGFMVVGVGIGSETALNGAAAHAFASVLYTALLLMSAGAVLHETGKRRMSELGGLARTMPVTAFCGLVGVLAISSFPATAGFVTKSLTMQAAAEAHMPVTWFILVGASAGVFLTAARFCWFTFFGGEGRAERGVSGADAPGDPVWNMRAAMWFLSALCVGFGLFPDLLYAILPYPVDYAPYTAAHLVYQIQLLLFAGLVFALLHGRLRPGETVTLDTDWFWRQFGRNLKSEFRSLSNAAWLGLAERTVRAASRFIAAVYRHHGPQGVLARSWPTGAMALWTAVMLAAYLLIYFL